MKKTPSRPAATSGLYDFDSKILALVVSEMTQKSGHVDGVAPGKRKFPLESANKFQATSA